MRLEIKRQESYSRGELLLRSFFGAFYILFPHAFLMLFFALWGAILSFISFWIILFTGRYPENWFNYQVKLQRWSLRVNARVYNLLDGYPGFGLDAEDDGIEFEVPYPESLSRGNLLLKAFFGVWYVYIPHMFVLYFRLLWGGILNFLAWWVVLFTGNYPADWHEFQVGTFRWSTRVGLYMGNMTDKYPPFSGRRDEYPTTTSTILDHNV